MADSAQPTQEPERVILHDLRRAIVQIENQEADIVLSSDGTVVVWNLHMERLFGWTATEAVGQTLDALILPERYIKAHQRGLTRYQHEGTSLVLCRRLIVEGKHKDGREIPLTLIVMVVSHNGSYRFLGYLNMLNEQEVGAHGGA